MNDTKDKRRLRSKNKTWRPVTWKPLYDLFVMDHVMGYSNVEIAKRHNITSFVVSRVLGSEQAIALIQKASQNLRKHYQQEIPEKLANLEVQSVKLMDRVLNDPDLINSKPLQVFDRALALVKGLGKNMKSEAAPGTVNNTQNNVIMTPETAKILTEGLAKANDAFLLHSGLPTDK